MNNKHGARALKNFAIQRTCIAARETFTMHFAATLSAVHTWLLEGLGRSNADGKQRGTNQYVFDNYPRDGSFIRNSAADVESRRIAWIRYIR